MLSEIIDAAKFVIEKIGAWRKASEEERAKTIKLAFDEVVEPSYRKLEAIHQDYTVKLSALREHLANRSLPPRELIHWLRNVGLEYRKDREFLATIEEELNRFSREQVNPTSNDTAAFYWHLQHFVKAVMKYYHCTTGHGEVSFYRDFESSLTVLLRQTGNADPASTETERELFYGAPQVADMCEMLLIVCDHDLPTAWKEVSIAFRAARQVAGKAMTK